MQIMTRSENQQNPREKSGWKMITMEQLRRIELIVLPLSNSISKSTRKFGLENDYHGTIKTY